MTIEEAKAIRACNGRAYSTVEFIKALQLTEPNPPKDCSREGKEMITEDYVSFETAKLLKEKGFWENCPFSLSKLDEKTNDVETVRCPTLQMAMKWLRTVHNKSIEIRSQGLKATSIGWIVEIFNLVNQDEELHHPYTFSTYEEACESAIKYCLENLVP